MIKVFSAVILLFFLMPVSLPFAQETSGGVKIYSGYLHQYSFKDKTSLWSTFFGPKHPRQEEVLQDRQCFVEFKSPIPFSHQSVAVVPESLTYSVRFKNSLKPSSTNTVKEKDIFEKFVIKIYTNDDQEYSIDPNSDGKIFDPYLVYLVLGSDINHLEIISSSGDEHGRYVLDKLEIDNKN